MTITCFIRYEIDPFPKGQSKPTPITGSASIADWVGICWATFCRTRAATTRREGDAAQAGQRAFGRAPSTLAACGQRSTSQIGL